METHEADTHFHLMLNAEVKNVCLHGVILIYVTENLPLSVLFILRTMIHS